MTPRYVEEDENLQADRAREARSYDRFLLWADRLTWKIWGDGDAFSYLYDSRPGIWADFPWQS